MISALEPDRDFDSPFHSQGTLATGVSRMAFVSGQVGVRPDGTRAEGLPHQSVVAMENVQRVLDEGDLNMGHVTKLTVYLTDPAHIGQFVGAAAPFLGRVRPAATLLIVAELAAPGLLVQVEAIAVG